MIYQRSDPPVCQLKLLFGLDFAIIVKQKRERKTSAREVENLCCDVTVKHVHHVDGEVALKPRDITDGTVHNFQNLGIGKYLIQNGQVVPEWKRVNEIVLRQGGDLEQK